MVSSYDIIQTLVRTEKGSLLEKDRQYLFEVSSHANKVDIKKAVEEVYNVKVASVNVMMVPGKKKRVRRDIGYTTPWKKAIVTLQEGHAINVT